jgi:hypothetical protein
MPTQSWQTQRSSRHDDRMASSRHLRRRWRAMSDGERSSRQLVQALRDVEARYDAAKSELAADDVFALWAALWRFSEKVIADHRRLKAAERKRRTAR